MPLYAPLHILELLATYGFLTVSQFKTLGITLSKKTIGEILAWLRDRNWIARKTFHFGPAYGKVEDMHHLLPKGKKYLIQQHRWQAEDIKMTIGSSKLKTDYRHRKMTINVHIALQKEFQQYGYETMFYDHYFQGRKKPYVRWRETATKIDLSLGSIIADSVAHIKHSNWSQLLFCIELHRGQRVKKICQQLKNYVQAISLGSPSTKYNLTIGNRVLIVFEEESTLYTTIERLKDDPIFRRLKDHFLFIPYDSIKIDTTKIRTDLDNKTQPLFTNTKSINYETNINRNSGVI